MPWPGIDSYPENRTEPGLHSASPGETLVLKGRKRNRPLCFSARKMVSQRRKEEKLSVSARKMKRKALSLKSGTYKIQAQLKIGSMPQRVFHGKWLFPEKAPEKLLVILKIISIIGVVHAHTCL